MIEHLSRQLKDEGLVNQVIDILTIESVGIGYGRAMTSLVSDDLSGFNLGDGNIEIVKSLIMGYNFGNLHRRTKENLYKVYSDDQIGMADGFIQRFWVPVNGPYTFRQGQGGCSPSATKCADDRYECF